MAIKPVQYGKTNIFLIILFCDVCGSEIGHKYPYNDHNICTICNKDVCNNCCKIYTYESIGDTIIITICEDCKKSHSDEVLYIENLIWEYKHMLECADSLEDEIFDWNRKYNIDRSF